MGSWCQLLYSVGGHDRGAVFTKHFRKADKFISPATFLEALSLVGPHDRAKAVESCVKFDPSNFCNFGSVDWAKLLTLISLHDRISTFLCLMEHLPNAALDASHISLLGLHDRGTAAASLIQFLERQKGIKAKQTKERERKAQELKDKEREEIETAIKLSLQETEVGKLKPTLKPPPKPTPTPASKIDDDSPPSLLPLLLPLAKREAKENDKAVAKLAKLAKLQKPKVINEAKITKCATTDKENEACTLCHKNKINVLGNCGHAFLCLECIEKFGLEKCPSCRKDVTTFTVFA